MWIDIASIVFVCVTMNHLGLIGAIEGKIGFSLPVLNCPKCSSFWSVLAYGLVCRYAITTLLALSFLASYSALWLELLEAFIDTLYMKLYGKITSDNSNNAPATDPEHGHSAGSLP